MTLSDEERGALIEYRAAQAHEAIEDAEFLIANDKLKLAVNRIYYGMFYMLRVLALKYQFKTSKHIGLIAWFNKTFIKEKLIDRKYGRIVKNAFDSRSDSDYGVMVKFEREEVEQMLEDMEDFISTIEQYIKDQL